MGGVLQKFRKIIALFLIIATTISFSGCSSTGTSKQAPKTKVTLTIWQLFDSPDVMQPIINDYISDKSENYDLNIIYEKKDYSDYLEASTNALAAGAGPDIWMIRNDWVPREIDKIVEAPSDIVSTDEFKSVSPNLVNSEVVIDNKIYGIPWSVDTLALYYNQDIFNKVRNDLEDAKAINNEDTILEDAPANWEDFIRTSKLLTVKNGDKIERAGAALGTTGNISNATDILSALMLQNHTQMVSDDLKTATFNLAIAKESGEPVYSGTKALEFYKSFADPSKDVYTWNDSMPDSVQAFIDGKTAMMINYSYIQKNIFEKAPNFNYSIAPLPQIKDSQTAVDYSTYWLETVTKNCEHPEIAWDFIKYVRDKKISDYLQATKRPSPFKVADEEVPIVKERLDSKNETFRIQVNTAQNWYRGKFPLRVDDIFKELIVVTNRGQSAQSAIDAAASKVTTLLQKEPY